jgi:hypothetical protein
MSCLALFVALGGASYAAVSLPNNSVGAKQIKNASIDNTKVKKGSLLKSSFKSGQLPAGARGAKGAKGAIGLTGVTGLAGAIKLGSFTHHAGQDVPGDSQWHNFVTTTFTSVANTIYVPVDYSDFLNQSLTGTDCPGTAQTLFSRTVVNGVSVSPVDNNGNTYQPQFLGPYPAGTSITLEMQYKLDCATQVWHSPAGDLAMVPYQTS